MSVLSFFLSTIAPIEPIDETRREYRQPLVVRAEIGLIIGLKSAAEVLRCGLLLLAALVAALATSVSYAGPQEDGEQLRQADLEKVYDYPGFEKIVDDLAARTEPLSEENHEFLQYLLGWRSAYRGNYQQAIATLRPIAGTSRNLTIRFRAAATIVNVTALSKQYDLAFAQLQNLLELFPNITDQSAREQGLSVTAYLYNLVGEQELGLRYAQTLREENLGGRGTCTGGHLEMQSLYQDKTATLPSARFQEVIDACEAANERVRANSTRLYAAKRLMGENRFEDALGLLAKAYDSVVKLGSPQITSDYEATLAECYRQTANPVQARQYALRAVANASQNEYSDQLVRAYRLLYLFAKEHGDTKAALEYHERFAAADKGYLNDVGARQLAYQRVKHEVDASKLQIEALNRQNEVLKLQRQLGDKAVENFRLYVVLSTVVLGFILLWAYLIKRSQVHFMKLSRQDGLTGLYNRPHFIDLSTRALNAAKKSGQEICVVICDLDYFKAINDNLGHATGDDVLKKTALAFQSRLHKQDIVGRLGGEEFGLIFVGCNLCEARQRCENMRAVLAEIVIEANASKSRLSASFGISTTATSGHEFRQLLAHADSALYRAKRTGRDRVVLHGDENSQPPVVEMDAQRRMA